MKTKFPPNKSFLISCPSPAPLRGWTSHLQVRAGRGDGCPPACPSEGLTRESVRASVCVCVCACVLINIRRAGQRSGCGCRWERERTVLFTAAQGEVCWWRGVMSQKQAERREEKAEGRGVEEAQGQAATFNPPPSTSTITTTSHTHTHTHTHTQPSLNLSCFLALPSLSHSQQAKRHQGSPTLFFSLFTIWHSFPTSFCLALCLFCSTSHSNLKKDICMCSHARVHRPGTHTHTHTSLHSDSYGRGISIVWG